MSMMTKEKLRKSMKRGCKIAVMLCVTVGCTNVAQVTTFDDPSCKSTVRDQLNSVLIEEGEKSEIAERLAVNTTTVLATGILGPRPFGVSSPSGVDYSFFIQRKDRSVFCNFMAVKRASPGTRIISPILQPVH